jgi:hypothetical protein
VSSSRAMAMSWWSGNVGCASHTNRRCFATRGVAMKRGRSRSAATLPCRASTWRHQKRRQASRLFFARSACTKASAWAKGASNSAALASAMVQPKSTIHMSRGRRVTSNPFTQWRSTSALGRPFGFSGRRSRPRAVSPGMSKAPPLVSPMKAMFAFSRRRRAAPLRHGAEQAPRVVGEARRGLSGGRQHPLEQRRRLMTCATAWGSCPRRRSRPGSEKTCLRSCRFAGSASSGKSWRSETALVQLGG